MPCTKNHMLQSRTVDSCISRHDLVPLRQSNNAHTPCHTSMRVSQVTVKTIEALIDRACRSDLKGPSLELNMAIIDTLRNHPKHERHAAFYLLGYINGLYGPPAMLALSLLDGCVVNLGFSFQYIIGTKEFLNKLVWKFPVDAPRIIHQVMEKILYLIHKWYLGISTYPPYSDDLSNIRAMHRLLSSKGYQFPHIPQSEINVMIPKLPLQSKREMEQERTTILNTRLKELLRRGRPEDLRAANDLIKEMTGYDPETRPNYMLMIERELRRIREKADKLNHLMGSDWNGIEMTERSSSRHQSLIDLYSYCKQAYTRTERLLNKEEDGSEEDSYPLDALRELHDTLSRVLRRYESPHDASNASSSHTEDTGQICLLDLDVETLSSTITMATPSQNTSANSSMTDLRLINDIVQEHPNLPKDLTELMDLRFNGNLLM